MHATDVIKLTTQSMASSLPSVVIICGVGRQNRREFECLRNAGGVPILRSCALLRTSEINIL